MHLFLLTFRLQLIRCFSKQADNIGVRVVILTISRAASMTFLTCFCKSSGSISSVVTPSMELSTGSLS